MTTLTICNHKGGTGKTTTVVHMAAALGLSGHRTLVIDLDPQCFLSRTLGVGEPKEAESSLALFDPQILLRDVPVQKMSGFDLLPASSVLTKAMRSLNKHTDVLWAKEAIEQGLDYDVLLFDTAAAVTVFSLNALVASQHVLIPVTPEYQPVVGAELTYQTALLVQDKLNPSLCAPLFLLTQVDARKRNHTTFRKYLKQNYGELVLNTQIRTNSSLSMTRADGTTTFDHEPHSRGALDYANATDELLRCIEMQRKGMLRSPHSQQKARDEQPVEVDHVH